MDFDDGFDEPQRVCGALQRGVDLELRLVFVRPVAAAPGRDDAQAVDTGDDRHTALVGLVLVEHQGVDLALEQIQTMLRGDGDEEIELCLLQSDATVLRISAIAIRN